MAPQGISKYINESAGSSIPADVRPGVEYAQQYGNAMTQAARKFQMIILAAWASSTVLIGTQRLLLREEPFKFQLLGKKILEIPKPGILSENQVEHLDNILFTVNYALLSYLMVLQFIAYGTVKTKTVVN